MLTTRPQAAPNAQFWPYYDETTGERHMAIKTIKPIACGQVLMPSSGRTAWPRAL